MFRPDAPAHNQTTPAKAPSPGIARMGIGYRPRLLMSHAIANLAT